METKDEIHGIVMFLDKWNKWDKWGVINQARTAMWVPSRVQNNDAHPENAFILPI
jgi:hypothetical protein